MVRWSWVNFQCRGVLQVGGGRVVRWSWVNFQCRGVLQFGYSRARAYCSCSRCGWGWLGHFYSHLSFLSSFSLSLGDGSILTEILSQRAVKPKTTNQPNPTSWMIVGQGPIALAVGAGRGCLDIFTLLCPLSPPSPFLWVWLVGCFGFNGPLRQYFSLYRAVSQREGERRERIDESKNVQTTPTRTYCKRNRPLPYCNQNCRTPRHWKFTQHHRTTRPPPPFLWETARYRLKYCLKGLLNLKQATN